MMNAVADWWMGYALKISLTQFMFVRMGRYQFIQGCVCVLTAFGCGSNGLVVI